MGFDKYHLEKELEKHGDIYSQLDMDKWAKSDL